MKNPISCKCEYIKEKMIQKEKLKIKLSPLESTLVHTPTQEDYNSLMQIYECGGWRWNSRSSPTVRDYWAVFKEKTCVSAKEYFKYDSINCLGNRKVISSKRFCKIQGINKGQLGEIKKYFKEKK